MSIKIYKLHLDVMIEVRIGRGLPSVKIYIHPAETHRYLKFLFHIMGRLVPAHNKTVDEKRTLKLSHTRTNSRLSLVRGRPREKENIDFHISAYQRYTNTAN